MSLYDSIAISLINELKNKLNLEESDINVDTDIDIIIYTTFVQPMKN